MRARPGAKVRATLSKVGGYMNNDPVQLGAVRRFHWLSPAVYQALLVAAGGYAVVAVFLVTFLFVRWRLPEFALSLAAVVGTLFAAPLALGMLWNRLGRVKVLGVEVELSSVTVRIDEKMSDVFIKQQYFSGAEHLIAQIRDWILLPETEVVEVNLHSEPYWWSTRLFVLAAIAQEFSNVKQFLFVENGEDRLFVGMVAPGALRRAISAEFPSLEKAYLTLRNDSNAARDPVAEVERLVNSWTIVQFQKDGKVVVEQDMKCLVTKESISDWLRKSGEFLSGDHVRWDGGPDSPLLLYGVLALAMPYVPLVKERRLERVVNRAELAIRIADNALRQQILHT
jgi:hypothetical protein